MERRFSYSGKDIISFIEDVEDIGGLEWRFFYNCDGRSLSEQLKPEFERQFGLLLYGVSVDIIASGTQKVLPIEYSSIGIRFEEAQCYFTPFASTPNFPVAIIKREIQIGGDLYIVGINIDSQMAEAKQFEQKGKQEALQKLEDTLRKLPHAYLPQSPQPI